MKKLMFVLIASACCTAFAMNASAQQADQATSDAVIAMVKAQWAAEIKDPTNVAEQSKDMSDDYTEFNGQYATRLDGKAMNSRMAEASGKNSGKTIGAEMANPQSPGIQRECCHPDLQTMPALPRTRTERRKRLAQNRRAFL